MEISEKEWSKAINVADRTLKLVPDACEIVETVYGDLFTP